MQDCYSCPAHTWSPDGSSLKTNCTCEKGYTAGICRSDYVCNASLFENALELDGTPGSRALFAQGIDVSYADMTLGFSLRLDAGAVESSGYHSIISLTCDNVPQFKFYIQNDTYLMGGEVFNQSLDSDNVVAPTSQNVTGGASVWTHWALRFDFANMNLSVYKDGVVETTVAVTANFTCYENLSLGAVVGDPADRPVTASIDDFVVYTRALSGTEVASLASMQGRKIETEDALVGVYDFNGVGASRVVDTSGRSNRAELSGGA